MADAGWHRESALRDYLFEHPEVLFDKPVDHKHRELCVEGKFIDLMFEVDGVHHIVELKRDQVTREAVGQVLEYYARLRRLNPDQAYRVMLVAPNIPEYRRLPLEEFGIRCVEVRPLGDQAENKVVSEQAMLRSAVKSARPVVMDTFAIDRLSLPTFLPPCSSGALQLSHSLLANSLPEIEREFSSFEIKPVPMKHPKHQDMLCLRNESGHVEYVRPGVWWAYAFGESEQMPKNDKPNISVNGYPWGLDVAINAELRTSQRVVLKCVAGNLAQFDNLLTQHGQLELQLWMKLEQQPRFYHWALLERHRAGAWDGNTLLNANEDLRQKYPELRQQWFTEIFANQKGLTQGQRRHMERTNREMNLAIRLVHTFDPVNAIWGAPLERQMQSLATSYCSLRPLIEFFH